MDSKETYSRRAAASCCPIFRVCTCGRLFFSNLPQTPLCSLVGDYQLLIGNALQWFSEFFQLCGRSRWNCLSHTVRIKTQEIYFHCMFPCRRKFRTTGLENINFAGVVHGQFARLSEEETSTLAPMIYILMFRERAGRLQSYCSLTGYRSEKLSGPAHGCQTNWGYMMTMWWL